MEKKGTLTYGMDKVLMSGSMPTIYSTRMRGPSMSSAFGILSIGRMFQSVLLRQYASENIQDFSHACY